ncbi:MAG TPA: DUF2169 domain-containing protein [Gammaproteobacteria bacterium]
MQVYKPLELSLFAKPFRFGGKDRWSAGAMLAFPLTGGEVLLEQDLWKAAASALGQDAVLDACMPKPRGEVLVAGAYHAPGGNRVEADRVAIEVGPVKKELAVFGNRYWQMGVATSPEPMRSMPLTWEHAFGGEGFDRNPLGKGMQEVDVFGEMRRPLPNVENPKKLIEGSGQRPEPAGFMPLDMMWPQRLPKAGTYDERWVREIAPGLAEDIDWEFFNVAPEDQWLEGFFAGGEKYRVTNMNPDNPELAGVLPEYRVRCFIERKKRENDFHEITLRAETLWLLPGENVGILIYRGTANIDSDDGTDIATVLLAYENAGDAARDIAHYQAAMQGRKDPETQLKYAVNTRDIIPENARCGFARMLEANPGAEFIRQQQAKARAEEVRAEMDGKLAEQRASLEKQLRDAGVDPAPYLEKFDARESELDPALKALLDRIEQMLPADAAGAASMDLGGLDQLQKDLAAYGEAQRAQAAARVAQLADAVKTLPADAQAGAQQKIDDATARMHAKQPLPRPPAATQLDEIRRQLAEAERARERLRSEGIPEDRLPRIPAIDLAAMERQLDEAAALFVDGYRMGAHLIEDGTPPLGVPGNDRVDALLAHLGAGAAAKGMDNGDFAGIALPGRDLAGANFENAFLEDADFTRANLSGANLRGAILPRAKLRGAKLKGADLTGANLGGADLEGADLAGAKLGKAILSAANLSGAMLADAVLEEAMLLDATFTKTNFSRVKLPNAVFLNQDLAGACFREADLSAVAFVNVKAAGADFSGALMDKTTFLDFVGSNAQFVNAKLANTRFIHNCNLSGSVFTGARGTQVSFRGANLEYADLVGTSLPECDFSQANLAHAKLDEGNYWRSIFADADMSAASLVAANLMEARFRKTRIVSADFSKANCFSIDFTGATLGETRFDGANLKRTVLQDWRP